MPKIPNYKKKNGYFVAIFTNQQLKVKQGFIHFPKTVNIPPMKTSVSKPKQVRITPQATCFVVEIVYEKGFNKRKAKLQSQLPKGIFSTLRINHLIHKRNQKINDYIHKTS